MRASVPAPCDRAWFRPPRRHRPRKAASNAPHRRRSRDSGPRTGSALRQIVHQRPIERPAAARTRVQQIARNAIRLHARCKRAGGVVFKDVETLDKRKADRLSQYGGGSSPCSCSVLSPTAPAQRPTSLTAASMNTPTVETNGGRALTIRFACGRSTRRGESANTSPIASARRPPRRARLRVSLCRRS